MTNLLCKFLSYTSGTIAKHIDLVAVFYLISWFWMSIQYFFFYESFFVPNFLVIDHYLNFSFASWIFLFAHYNRMRLYGKATVLGFTVMLLVNSYQLHFGFEDTNYFLAWVGVVFALIMIAYGVCVSKYIRELFYPKYL